MDPGLFAFLLGMGSAVTLAGANTFVKAAKDILGGRAVMAITSALLALPIAFFVPTPEPQTWAILAVSLACATVLVAVANRSTSCSQARRSPFQPAGAVVNISGLVCALPGGARSGDRCWG